MKKIILAGGNGFVGRAFAHEAIAHGYDIVVLTRTPATSATSSAIRQVQWDGKTLGPWAAELDGAAAVVNFTGRNVNCRYNAKNRQAILESRVDSVRVIDKAILACRIPPKVVVQAATLAIVALYLRVFRSADEGGVR